MRDMIPDSPSDSMPAHTSSIAEQLDPGEYLFEGGASEHIVRIGRYTATLSAIIDRLSSSARGYSRRSSSIDQRRLSYFDRDSNRGRCVCPVIDTIPRRREAR
jgi:hypothetical protein